MGARQRVGRPLAALPAAALGTVAAGLLAACTAGGSAPPTGEATPTPTATVPTTVSITPVNPDGLTTGPGVTADTITLGLLVDAARDRGFRDGVDLWRRSVNGAGGICGRTIELVGNGEVGLPTDVLQAYDTVGLASLGLITLPPAEGIAAINSRIAADQLPALTSEGTFDQLGPDRPIVVGATDDILVITALDQARQAGLVAEGDVVGVVADGSASATNALEGVRWWARRWAVELDVRIIDADLVDENSDALNDPALARWSDAAAVVALTPAAAAGRVLQETADQTVVMLADGFDPAAWTAAARADAARVLVGLPTPAAGSEHPATQAVVAAFAAGNAGAPDLRLLTGYATATAWGRLLTGACEERTLTRRGIEAAVRTVGPAPAQSLLGVSDPAAPVLSGLPATREAAVGRGEPAAAGGLAAVTGLVAADGIEAYPD